MVTAIIPARGGSKGIAYKNVVPVGGHPLIAWSIRQAQQASLVRRVIVTTDCDEIAEVAHDECAEVFWRSCETATDTATTESAILEVLEHQEEPDPLTLLLQATSPIRQPTDIDRAITALELAEADSLFAARRVEGYCWRQTLDAGLVLLHDNRVPRQLRADTVWEENGSLYVFRTQLFLEQRTRLCGRTICFPMDPLDSYQIDEPEDIARIESLLPMRLPHVSHVGI